MTFSKELWENIRKEYIGKWFVMKSHTYIPYIPIKTLEEIRNMTTSSAVTKIGRIIDLDFCLNVGPVFKEGVFLIKIIYESSCKNFKEKNGFFISYDALINTMIIGDTEDEACNAYRLKCEVNDE